MYCNKENINILTSLLCKCGITDVVVCPGSRNAALTHNFNECETLNCYPITDERSAGFYALGMMQALRDETGNVRPVAVCVTSGTALLNLAPAVAEAFYQHLPLIVISADRPACWIGQLDGQTLPQTSALGALVGCSVTLPEPATAEERWHCNCLVNKALACATSFDAQPAHINVPISEPLFECCVPSLPEERLVRVAEAAASDASCVAPLLESLKKSARPMLVLGQNPCWLSDEEIVALGCAMVVLHEPTGRNAVSPCLFDDVLYAIQEDERYIPDLIIYAGDTVVSKRLKRFLRKTHKAEQWRLETGGGMPDTFMGLSCVLRCNPSVVLPKLAADCVPNASATPFVALWNEALKAASQHASDYQPPFSSMAAVKYMEEQFEDLFCDYAVHYGNSTPIRLANIYAWHHVWCNRGVNGIEGSLSAAAGFSVKSGKRVFCVIGDLSFFYDQNALWNANLHGNLRIILLNNGKGAIFDQLKGLDESAARDTYVAASHATQAQGICTQNDIGYMKAADMQEMQVGVVRLMTAETQRPMLLEVLIPAEDDEKAMKEYYETIKTYIQ